MNADVFQLIPAPLNLILFIAGAWAVLWDARSSYLLGNFVDARVSRTLGIVYIVVGAILWFVRRIVT